MKIGNYEMGMKSEYQARQKLEISESARTVRQMPSTDSDDKTVDQDGKNTALVNNEDGSVSLSPEALALLRRDPKVEVSSLKLDENSLLDSKLWILKKTVEALTGKKISLGPVNIAAMGNGLAGTQVMPQQAVREVLQTYTYSEEESVSFSAFGSVATQDGRTFGFSLDFSLNRSYTETTTQWSRQVVNLTDPLVLNFEGTAAELSENAKINFDLDADGRVEEISFVGSGSGFLALDTHNDKSVRDGSQLFGTTSGNGFADLAAYDQDGNHWIDENDDVFARLLIWGLDENGNQHVQTLKEANVGAIYLGHVGTQFSMKGEDQKTTLGEMRSSGVFLTEDGRAGTVQQIDLAV